jgi:GT2 family glycosyltransferase
VSESPARCQIRHVDLAGELPPLAVDPGYDLLLAVFWWRELPLGQRLLVAGELPVPPAITASLAAAAVAPAVEARLGGPTLASPDLARLAAPAAAADGRSLSVIVCTRDRPEDLARCLESLLPALPGGAEIVVVDNAPARPATREVCARFPTVRRVEEPAPGLSRARNAGIGAARGTILAFTDDDVVVHPRWAERIAGAFDDPEVACVTGLVLPAELESEPQLTFELALHGLGRGFVPHRYGPGWFKSFRLDCPPVWQLGAGANMAIRRDAVREVGAFDPRLGAGASGCSEDSELWYRLLAAGHACRYLPEAVVFHHHRREWASLRAQAYQYMRGHVAALLVQLAHGRDARNLFRLGVRLPTYYLGQSLRALLGRCSYGRQRLLPAEIAGSLAGLLTLAWPQPGSAAGP